MTMQNSGTSQLESQFDDDELITETENESRAQTVTESAHDLFIQESVPLMPLLSPKSDHEN